MATKKERLAALERDIFKPDQQPDPRTRTRTVPMQVLNMSFPRTGTYSMQVALNILGYTSFHSYNFFSNTADCSMWDEALDAKFFNKGAPFTRAQWDQLLGPYSAVSADPPAIAFAEELIAAYPAAKVILVERDIDDWYKSYSESVVPQIFSRVNNLIADLDRGYVGKIVGTHRRWLRGWMKAGSEEELRANARAVYKAHYEMVRRVTPGERLLEFKLSEGWGPLCEFLGKEVPGEEFPRLNDGEQLAAVIRLLMWRGARRVVNRVAVWGVPVLVLVAVVFYMR